MPEGSWYCTRCLPIVTSVGSLSDSDNGCYHGDGDLDDSSDGNIVASFNSAQRRNGRISSDSSSNDSNFSADDDAVSSLPSSQISSNDDVSSFITMTTDSDNSAASQQCSSNSGYAVTDSNHDSDVSSPHRETIASRITLACSNRATPSDCLIAESNHGNRNHSLPEQSICSHGDNIKRRLRNHGSIKNGHQVCMRRNSAMRCILSVSDSEQSDFEYLPPCDSYPSSSSDTHIEMHPVKSSKKKVQSKISPLTVSKSRRIKRRHKNKIGKNKNKRRKLQNRSLQHLMATPTGTAKRARTVATSPRMNPAVDTPQSAIRRLAKARCQAASLEEARKMSQIPSGRMTQNEIIACHVRSQQQQQQKWWDRKVIDCYKSNTKVVCSPLKNAIKRHPLISSASLK